MKELDENKIEKIVTGKDEKTNELLSKNGMFTNLEEFEKNFFENNPLKF